MTGAGTDVWRKVNNMDSHKPILPKISKIEFSRGLSRSFISTLKQKKNLAPQDVAKGRKGEHTYTTISKN